MRYKIYKWILDDFFVIDTLNKEYAIYKTNIHKQIYNKDEKFKKLSTQKINGFIDRSKNYNYFENGLVIDNYIYNYFLTDEQKKDINYSTIFDKSRDFLKECEEFNINCLI